MNFPKYFQLNHLSNFLDEAYIKAALKKYIAPNCYYITTRNLSPAIAHTQKMR